MLQEIFFFGQRKSSGVCASCVQQGIGGYNEWLHGVVGDKSWNGSFGF